MSAVNQACIAAFSKLAIVTGQAEFSSPGTATWVCPAGVFSVSAVAVGSGYLRGGGLGYLNNYTVVPGNSYAIQVGIANSTTSTGDSFLVNTSTCLGGLGGDGVSRFAGSGGANGGARGPLGDGTYSQGPGGAAGYSGNGGQGQGADNVAVGGGSSSGGGGGGGGNGSSTQGGGVGLKGEGTSGIRGAGNVNGTPGSSGSGVLYGGGSTNGDNSGSGGVRLIWPGDTRQYPSTNTADM